MCLCPILIFHAVRSGKFDHLIFYRDGRKAAAERIQDSPDERRSAAELLAKGKKLDIGDSVESVQAVGYYRKAAELGNVEAQFLLAKWYDKGEGVPQNREKALFWYRKAVEKSSSFSMESQKAKFILGRAYETGDGVVQDKGQAFEWYRKAAQGSGSGFVRRGNGDAAFALWRKYDTGDGVPQDKAQAAAWYREAALMGDVDAPMRLARMYADGNGVSRDMDKAILWYHWAASTGSGEAMLELGRIYAEGDGVPQDTWMAAAWYCKAHDNEQYLKGRQAVKELGVDIYDIRMKGKVMNVLLGHRMEMAKCKLMHAYGEGWASGSGKARAAELRAGTARLAARILKELAALKEEKGDDLPPRIMQLADAVQAEAKELQRMEAD